jgi:heme oxygenase
MVYIAVILQGSPRSRVISNDMLLLQDCDFHQSLELYRFVSAMALLSCGSIYFLGGILCFGLIKRSELQRSVHAAHTRHLSVYPQQATHWWHTYTRSLSTSETSPEPHHERNDRTLQS